MTQHSVEVEFNISRPDAKHNRKTAQPGRHEATQDKDIHDTTSTTQNNNTTYPTLKSKTTHVDYADYYAHGTNSIL